MPCCYGLSVWCYLTWSIWLSFHTTHILYQILCLIESLLKCRHIYHENIRLLWSPYEDVASIFPLLILKGQYLQPSVCSVAVHVVCTQIVVCICHCWLVMIQGLFAYVWLVCLEQILICTPFLTLWLAFCGVRGQPLLNTFIRSLVTDHILHLQHILDLWALTGNMYM